MLNSAPSGMEQSEEGTKENKAEKVRWREPLEDVRFFFSNEGYGGQRLNSAEGFNSGEGLPGRTLAWHKSNLFYCSRRSKCVKPLEANEGHRRPVKLRGTGEET